MLWFMGVIYGGAIQSVETGNSSGMRILLGK